MSTNSFKLCKVFGLCIDYISGRVGPEFNPVNKHAHVISQLAN